VGYLKFAILNQYLVSQKRCKIQAVGIYRHYLGIAIPDPFSQSRDPGICNPGIPGSRRDYRFAEIYQRTRKKIVDFHRRATTSVHLVNENNVIKTKVQLNKSISLY